MGLLVAGTKYRGEFEERLKKLMEEIKQSDEIILFIDEVHTLIGAGAAEGAIDAANILKPALARGELQVILRISLRYYNLIYLLFDFVIRNIPTKERYCMNAFLSRLTLYNYRTVICEGLPEMWFEQYQYHKKYLWFFLYCEKVSGFFTTMWPTRKAPVPHF